MVGVKGYLSGFGGFDWSSVVVKTHLRQETSHYEKYTFSVKKVGRVDAVLIMKKFYGCFILQILIRK